MITGSLVAIVTPMHEDGRLDVGRFKELIDWHVAEGTDGIVVVGTTGESPTVDFDEHKELIRLAVHHSRGRIPVIAGTGGNSTAEAIELTGSAKKARHRVLVGGALLQQADAGRPVPALPQDCRDRRPADDHVQRAGAHGGRSRQRHDAAPRAAPGIIGIKDATANIERGTDLIKQAPRNFDLQRRRRDRAGAHPARRPRRDSSPPTWRRS